MTPAALRHTLDLDVTGGSLEDLDANSMAVADLWGMSVGSTVPVLMADGQEVELRVAATYRALPGEDVAYLPPRFAGTAAYARDGVARRAYVSLEPGTDEATAAAAIRAALAGVTFLTTEELVASESAYARHLTEVRQRSNAVIIMRVFLAEAVLVAGIGVVLAFVATTVNLAGLSSALSQLFGAAPIVVPYATVLAVTVVSTVVAMIGTVLPVGAALRQHHPERGRSRRSPA